ncbi:MAG TPA: hypothetical protein VGK50_05905 [Coriobacteriia bacterium]|jgi:hypothetical protein
MIDEDLVERAALVAREARRAYVLATASIALALLSLASVVAVGVLSFADRPALAWLGPVAALGGLSAWAAGVASAGVALGSEHSRRALVGLALCAFAATCFVLMVLGLSIAA